METNTAQTPVTSAIERMRELTFFVGRWDAPGMFHQTPFAPSKPIDMRASGCRV